MSKIKSISYLPQDNRERSKIEASRDGTFRLPMVYSYYGETRTEYRNLTAKQAIEHKRIKHHDPVLTMENGNKVRVFQGGDSSYLPASVEGIILKHDNHCPARVLLRAGNSVKSNDNQALFDFDWGLSDDEFF